MATTSSLQDFASQVYARLSEMISARASTPLAALHGGDLPALSDFADLIENVFLASLYQEETRPTEIALVWVSNPATPGVVRLKSELPPDPKIIAKLAPAADQCRTPIAIRRGDGGMRLWGLLNQGTISPSALTLRALAAGTVRVDLLGMQVGLFARGDALIVRPEATPTYTLLTQALSPWREDAARCEREVSAKAVAATDVARRVLAHGHGGMLLILPAGEPGIEVRRGYELAQGAQPLRETFASLVALAEEPTDEFIHVLSGPTAATAGVLEEESPEKRFYLQALAFCARLAAVDGAVLLDTDLNVVAFGVHVVPTLGVKKEVFERISLQTGERKSVDLQNARGTRHASAVRFCLRQPAESAAIVVSQDARITLVVGTAGKVVVYGPYERGFAWE